MIVIIIVQTIAYFAIDALFASYHPVAIVIKLLLFYILLLPWCLNYYFDATYYCFVDHHLAFLTTASPLLLVNIYSFKFIKNELIIQNY